MLRSARTFQRRRHGYYISPKKETWILSSNGSLSYWMGGQLFFYRQIIFQPLGLLTFFIFMAWGSVSIENLRYSKQFMWKGSDSFKVSRSLLKKKKKHYLIR